MKLMLNIILPHPEYLRGSISYRGLVSGEGAVRQRQESGVKVGRVAKCTNAQQRSIEQYSTTTKTFFCVEAPGRNAKRRFRDLSKNLKDLNYVVQLEKSD